MPSYDEAVAVAVSKTISKLQRQIESLEKDLPLQSHPIKQRIIEREIANNKDRIALEIESLQRLSS